MAPHEVILELYQVHAVTAGTDAQAEVSVRLSENGKTVTEARARAYQAVDLIRVEDDIAPEE